MPTWVPNVNKYDLNFKKRIIVLFCRGKTRDEICKIVSKSKPIVSAIINKYYKLRNNNWSYSEMFERKVIYLYTHTKCGCVKIGKYLNIDQSCINEILKRNNINIRNFTDYRKYNLNEDYFEIIDTPEKAYWLGLMYADGCSSRNRISRLSLNEVDLQSLIDFRNDVCSNIPIQNGKHGMKILNLYSKKMNLDLANHGCVNNKTFKIKFPDINNELINHFIRGYFDGDGCITWHINKNGYLYCQASIAGTYDFLFIIRKILISLGFSKGSLIKRGNIYVLYIGGNNNIKKLFDFLYKDATRYMQRKYNKFNSYFEKKYSRPNSTLQEN